LESDVEALCEIVEGGEVEVSGIVGNGKASWAYFAALSWSSSSTSSS
jgi:hypothetical protein